MPGSGPGLCYAAVARQSRGVSFCMLVFVVLRIRIQPVTCPLATRFGSTALSVNAVLLYCCLVPCLSGFARLRGFDFTTTVCCRLVAVICRAFGLCPLRAYAAAVAPRAVYCLATLGGFRSFSGGAFTTLTCDHAFCGSLPFILTLPYAVLLICPPGDHFMATRRWPLFFANGTGRTKHA